MILQRMAGHVPYAAVRPGEPCMDCGDPLPASTALRKGRRCRSCYNALNAARQRGYQRTKRAATSSIHGAKERTLRCPTCREFKRFDVDGAGRVIEVCRCGTRWASAVE